MGSNLRNEQPHNILHLKLPNLKNRIVSIYLIKSSNEYACGMPIFYYLLCYQVKNNYFNRCWI